MPVPFDSSFRAIVSLVIWIAVASVAIAQTMNGKCDDELCVCVVPGNLKSESCPGWMKVTGGPYSTVLSTTCLAADGSGVIACQAWQDDLFQDYPDSKVNCVISPSGQGEIHSYLLTDGNSATAPPHSILLNYTLPDNPVPDCPIDPPFTQPPTMAPTITASPTGSPLTSGGTGGDISMLCFVKHALIVAGLSRVG